MKKRDKHVILATMATMAALSLTACGWRGNVDNTTDTSGQTKESSSVQTTRESVAETTRETVRDTSEGVIDEIGDDIESGIKDIGDDMRGEENTTTK